MHQEDGMPVSTEGLNDRLRSQTRTETPRTAPPPTLFRLPNLNPASETKAEATVAENFLSEDPTPPDTIVQRRFDSATTTEPAHRTGSLDEPKPESVEPESVEPESDKTEPKSSESDAAKLRLFDAADPRVKAPAHASHASDSDDDEHSIFEKIGSQTIVLGGLALLAGAAMLANQNRVPETIDAPIIDHHVDSPWPANLSSNPAVIATDSRLPAATGGGDPDSSLTPVQPFNPADQAFANPVTDLAAPQQRQVSQTGDNDDSLHLGSYQHGGAPTVLTPLVNPNRQNISATRDQSLQDPNRQNQPLVPSGTYDEPGPNEIPVAPIPTPDSFSTGDNLSGSSEPDAGFSGQQRSLRPEIPENLTPPDLSEPPDPDSMSHLNPPETSVPRPTVQLNRPTSPDGLRYSKSPLPIDWHRYLPHPGSAAEAQRPAAQTASPAPNSHTR